jgi:hypothetical protein
VKGSEHLPRKSYSTMDKKCGGRRYGGNLRVHISNPGMRHTGPEARLPCLLGEWTAHPTALTGQRRILGSWQSVWRTGAGQAPGRDLSSNHPAYLLSNQESTLDESVQHLLTVAVGRLAGLEGEENLCGLGRARPRSRGLDRDGVRPDPLAQKAEGQSHGPAELGRPDLQQ